jgi:hypothetical protein
MTANTEDDDEAVDKSSEGLLSVRPLLHPPRHTLLDGI